MSFDSDTAVTAAGPGAFSVVVPDHWQLTRRAAVNGGFVAAVVTRAMEAAVAEPARRPRSLTVHYVAACRPGPARVEVAVERCGSSLTTLSARLVQDGSPVAAALGAFGRDREGLDFQHLPMPEAPPPEEVAGWPWRGGVDGSFLSNWDHRPCIGELPYSGAAAALSGGWIRGTEPRPLDAPQLAAMADAWLPPVTTLMDRPTSILPTIDLTIHFRAALPVAGVEAGDYALAVFESRVGGGGYWESDGVIWARDGRVLAQARQLAAFVRRPA
jgi:acyl-CoA thioesterase